jgi:hypothetical protein
MCTTVRGFTREAEDLPDSADWQGGDSRAVGEREERDDLEGDG